MKIIKLVSLLAFCTSYSLHEVKPFFDTFSRLEKEIIKQKVNQLELILRKKKLLLQKSERDLARCKSQLNQLTELLQKSEKETLEENVQHLVDFIEEYKQEIQRLEQSLKEERARLLASF